MSTYHYTGSFPTPSPLGTISFDLILTVNGSNVVTSITGTVTNDLTGTETATLLPPGTSGNDNVLSRTSSAPYFSVAGMLVQDTSSTQYTIKDGVILHSIMSKEQDLIKLLIVNH